MLVGPAWQLLLLKVQQQQQGAGQPQHLAAQCLSAWQIHCSSSSQLSSNCRCTSRLSPKLNVVGCMNGGSSGFLE